MLSKENLYSKFPIIVQNIAVSFYGYNWKRRRFGGVFKDELKLFKDRENFTSNQWSDYQTQELRNLLCHAFETVPFYNKKYKQCGFTLSSFKRFELYHLDQLPILSKKELQSFGTSSLISSLNDNTGKYFSSSGSTGTPVKILFSNLFHQRWSAAFESRIRHWAGVDLSCKRGMIGGRLVVPAIQTTPPFHRLNFAEKQVYFSINHLSKRNIEDYVNAIDKYRLDYMTGYATSNYLLARYALDCGFTNRNLLSVITSSEKLTPIMRRTFGEFYNCKTFDSWSGIEACGLVSECEHGSLHISPDVGILEFLKDSNNNIFDYNNVSVNEILCTGLLNYDQPLIRYRIGDLMDRYDNDYCSCGRNLPTVKSIVGRIDDIITLKDGKQLSSFNRFFADINGISEVQVIQKDYDYFKLNIVPTKSFDTNTRKSLFSVFKDRIGEVQLDIELLDSIPRGSNGKFKAVVSEFCPKVF